MAVKLRLARHGAKKNPFYRIVATPSESPRDGRFLEILGTYNPKRRGHRRARRGHRPQAGAQQDGQPEVSKVEE